MAGLIGQTDPKRLFLFIPRCSAIHTCGMRTAIDVVFIAADGTVVAIHASLRPWRVRVGPRSAASTLELPPGHTVQAGVAVGDVVKLSPGRS
jgi:uncharacterized membrane protein (UPF0127 family)